MGTSIEIDKLIQDQEKQLKVLSVTHKNNKDSPWEEANCNSNNNPTIIDMVASRTLTPFLQDLKDVRPYKAGVSELGTGSITHTGTVQWMVFDSDGKEVVIQDNDAYFCKKFHIIFYVPIVGRSLKMTEDFRKPTFTGIRHI